MLNTFYLITANPVKGFFFLTGNTASWYKKSMKMTFTASEKQSLYGMGVSRQMIHLWSRGMPIGPKYAREVAKVKGIKLEDVLYPEKEEDLPE